MKKLTILAYAALLVLTASAQLSAQNIIWLESAFDSPRIVKSGPDGSEISSASLPMGSLPQNFAYTGNREALLWTSLAFISAGIHTLAANFTFESVIVDSQSALRGIAVDAAHNKIYWTSTNLLSGPKIWRADMDGGNSEVLIDFGPGSSATPWSICLDSTAAKMYWTNFGEGKTQWAETSPGATPEDLVDGLFGPSGLALANDLERIFWTDMNAGTINSSALDGTDQKLLVSDLSSPNSIAVHSGENRMVWTEMGSGKIKSATLDGDDVFEFGITAKAPTSVLFESFPVSVNDESSPIVPAKFALGQNYPNPFNPNTRIKFDVPKKADVKIDIYNMQGRLVRILTDSEKPAGSHILNWNGRDDLGRTLPSGVYLYRFVSNEFSQTKKMLLVR
jgi:hypothetical protein